MKTIRILLADDHEVIRDGLKALLEKNPIFSIVAEASNGLEAFQKAQEILPDIVIMDISMPVMNGMDAAKQLQEKLPDVKVIILSMHNEAAYITQCLENNVSGYILKNEGGREITKAIETIMSGGKYYSEFVTKVIIESFATQKKVSSSKKAIVELTARENQILSYIAQGYANQKIADSLFISYRTVETHRANLMKKLEAKNSIELLNKARANGNMVPKA